MRDRRRWVGLAMFLWLACCLASEGSTQESSWIVMVRHAEKADDTEDPELTEGGKERSRLLAAMLADAGIERVLSTDTIRTRDTARVLAERLGLEIELYEPQGLDALAVELKRAGGRTLVVGHSNTTPRLVELLGGDPGEAIAEDEYDRIYIVVLDAAGRVSSTILRFPPFSERH